MSEFLLNLNFPYVCNNHQAFGINNLDDNKI